MDKYDRFIFYNFSVLCVYLTALVKSVAYIWLLQNPLNVFKYVIKGHKFKSVKEFEDGGL